MEAGLACPDWPLCYGTLFPGRQMNLQVFLEWFHRLDAFVIGIALLFKAVLTLIWRRYLPKWVPWVAFGLVLLIALQGGLGALTVLQLLPSAVVMAHLTIAFLLLASLSALSQYFLSSQGQAAPLWWRVMGICSLLSVIAQSLIGSRMATIWAAQRCINHGNACQWVSLHRASAIPVGCLLLAFVFISVFAGGWTRSQWPFLFGILGLLIIQISLGMLSLSHGLSVPAITVLHQLVAALLVSVLGALSVRRPAHSPRKFSLDTRINSMEACHG